MREDEKDFLEESFRKEVLKSMDEKLSAKQKEVTAQSLNVRLLHTAYTGANRLSVRPPCNFIIQLILISVKQRF